ncbi:MAG: hypothetical protein F6K41_17620 [Symploca sp. SIO3E6]|nr:hypothetical protein [Caldora sp. SIO3E6]
MRSHQAQTSQNPDFFKKSGFLSASQRYKILQSALDLETDAVVWQQQLRAEWH